MLVLDPLTGDYHRPPPMLIDESNEIGIAYMRALGRHEDVQDDVDGLNTVDQPGVRTKFSGTTLGAYRRGRYFSPSEGGVIMAWTPCARMLSALGFCEERPEGVTWPHAYFIERLGGPYEPGMSSMFCPACRADPDRARSRPTEAPKTRTSSQLSLF